MPGTTALLKSAASRRSKIQDYEDSLVAYEYSLSQKTYQDFVDYSKYLTDRRSKTTDPSKALTYTKNINSAQSGYISNEIQRQSIDIIEGKATPTDKYNKMVGLYYQAVDSGNYDLAQSLHLQLNNLSVTIQNQMEAAQRAAGSLAMNGVKTLDALVKKITKGEEGVELADGTQIKSLPMLSKEVTEKGETSAKNLGYFGEAYRTIQALQQVIADAYAGAGTQEAVDAIESKYGDILDGTKEFKTAAGNLSMPEIELAYRSALANNPLYSPAEVRNPNTGALEYNMQKNKIDDFVWTRNDDGTYQAVEVRTKTPYKQQTLDTKVTNEGYFLGDSSEKGVSNIGTGEKVKTEGNLTIRERLANKGIAAEPGENGKLLLTLSNGEQVEGTIMPDGSVRYFGQPGQFSGGQAGMYEIDIFSDNPAREVSPDEVSIFGTQSKFGGLLSQASDAGVNIIKSLSGVSQNSGQPFSTVARITNTANDFTGTGVPVIGGNLQGTTQLLEQATQRQETLQALATAAQTVQPATVFNLNQTPVQQFAQNGAPIKQLTVAQPAPVRRLTVAAPQPVKPISGVSVATPGTISGVGVSSGSTNRLTVR